MFASPTSCSPESGRNRHYDPHQHGRARYAWVTLLPLCFVGVTTLTAGYMIVRDRFWPMAIGPNPALNVQGYVNTICTSFMMVLVVLILASAARRCFLVLTGKAPVREVAQA